MILQALYEYYQRKAADPESQIAPEGWEWKEIPFLVVIDKEGNFLRFEDTREGEGPKKQAKRILVPQGEKRASGIKAFLLWDNIEYALGANPRNRDDIALRAESFRKRVEEVVHQHVDLGSMLKFLQSDPIVQIEKIKSPVWQEMLLGNVFVSFKVEKSSLGTVCDALSKNEVAVVEEKVDRCLVTGEKSKAERLHPSIKGVKGTNTTGGSIVSFNLSAFCSYGKVQNSNASVSYKATCAYTTALNVLLGKGSLNKVGFGDTTVVFWAQKKSEGFDLESEFSWFFTSEKDNPDKGVNSIKALYQAAEMGRLPLDEGNKFYVLGLAPNAARISIRFWKMGSVDEFVKNIRQHFVDFEIIRSPKDSEFLSLYQIITSTVLDYKMSNIPPKLSGDVITSVLDGRPYPRTLFLQCIRRIRAEQKVTRTRASILKACINRFNHFYNSEVKEVCVALDKTNNNAGYLIGRLFAVLEKIQEEAQPGINATIRDRFYGAASSTPVTVFPQLLKLKNHHLAKLSPGRKVNMEKSVQEIVGDLQSFPSHLTMDQQAMFAIGYYHQRSSFFVTAKQMSEE